jgi:hypothetical protein
MPARPDDALAQLFKEAHGVMMPHTGKLGHGSDGHFGFGDLEQLGLVRFRREPFPDRFLNVDQGFLAVLALRMAAAQRRTTHRNAVLVFNQRDPVFHEMTDLHLTFIHQ